MSRFERFFLAPSSAKPLAIFRIAFGLFAAAEILLLAPAWLELFGSEGLIQWVVSKEIFSVEAVPHLQPLSEAVSRFGVSGDAVVHGICCVYLVALIAVVFGFCTRWAALLAWALHLVIWNTGILYGYGVESFTRICLFYLIFMPASQHYALDMRWRKSRCQPAPSWSATLSYRVLQIHLCIVYLNSGIAKVQGVEWRNGEAIWRVLGQPEYSHFDMQWLAQFPRLALALCWGTLVLELGYAIFIWPQRTRALFLVGIICMHVVGIALFMGLYGFGTVMTILNLAAFGHCTEWRTLPLFPRTAPARAVRAPLASPS